LNFDIIIIKGQNRFLVFFVSKFLKATCDKESFLQVKNILNFRMIV